jgi:Phosphodiester glycosidase
MTTILRTLSILAVSAAVAGAAVGGAAAAPEESGAGATLAVREGGRWITWWRENAAPVRWDGRGPLARRVAWRAGATGIEWGELQLRGASEAWRTRLVLVRMDPRQVALALDPAFSEDRRWTVNDAGAEAAVAFAAGQFRETLPWGWVRTGGREILGPQYAPLAGAVVVDSNGTVRVIAPDSVAAEHRRGTAREAFQSYPMLLENGAVPAPLREAGRGVNIGHRDARLALCTLADGRVVVALTRFDALGEALGRIPFGLTSAEMAAVMGALGCRQALLLDGGISGQLRLREADGSVRSWPGTRSVPLGLVGRSLDRNDLTP